MTEDNNNKPKHDEFFKRVIKNKPDMHKFLERHLHPALKPMVDLTTAKLEKESYVDESLKKLFSDVVISIKKKRMMRKFLLMFYWNINRAAINGRRSTCWNTP